MIGAMFQPLRPPYESTSEEGPSTEFGNSPRSESYDRVDLLAEVERTCDGNGEVRKPTQHLRVLLDSDAEHLCREWAEVAKAIIMRQSGR